ncbi:hypothetical protein PV726_12550 [Streptomyces europaeiscabiei]|uniref:hypothetical protein n=1 Tax=Streptomyces europaeiscabiei TaxID=146819 RepID=UPI0029B7B001|nr:hypothetical protein [Streptomyces europaeiscabiei]MDX3691149.1 hypothetical protein [Streptomyces europaeiscabiei]
MRTVRRAPVVVLAAAALAVALTACTGSPDGQAEQDKPAAGQSLAAAESKACENGTFTWVNVEQPTRLIAVADAERMGEGGGEFTRKLRWVRTPEVSVEAEGPTLDSADVLFSLGQRIGYFDADAQFMEEAGNAFIDVGNRPELSADLGSVTSAGNFVNYAYAKAAEGDFRYSCADGETTLGHAESWRVDGEGSLTCDQVPSDSAVALEAARISCSADSVAAKAGQKAADKALAAY